MSRRSCCMMLDSRLIDEGSDAAADRMKGTQSSSMTKGTGGRKRNKKKRVTIKEGSEAKGAEGEAKDEIEDLTAQWIDASSMRKPSG